MAGVAYYLLAHSLVQLHGKNSTLGIALGKDWKGILSVVVYAIGVAIAFVNAWISLALYAAVAITWFIPDKRIEKTLADTK